MINRARNSGVSFGMICKCNLELNIRFYMQFSYQAEIGKESLAVKTNYGVKFSVFSFKWSTI